MLLYFKDFINSKQTNAIEFLFRDIVALLLSHEASANSVDHKGCTPLHLAAWSGNAEIVKILLTHGPSFPSVNQMVYIFLL